MTRDPHRLVGRLQQVAHSVRRTSDRMLAQSAGLTTAQAAVGAVIHADPGCSQREVARRLGLGEPALVAAVGRLVDAGLVERRTSTEDPRAAALFLTPRGDDAITRAQATYAVLNRAIVDALGEDGRARLAELLDDLDAAVTRAGEEQLGTAVE